MIFSRNKLLVGIFLSLILSISHAQNISYLDRTSEAYTYWKIRDVLECIHPDGTLQQSECMNYTYPVDANNRFDIYQVENTEKTMALFAAKYIMRHKGSWDPVKVAGAWLPEDLSVVSDFCSKTDYPFVVYLGYRKPFSDFDSTPERIQLLLDFKYDKNDTIKGYVPYVFCSKNQADFSPSELSVFSQSSYVLHESDILKAKLPDIYYNRPKIQNLDVFSPENVISSMLLSYIHGHAGSYKSDVFKASLVDKLCAPLSKPKGTFTTLNINHTEQESSIDITCSQPSLTNLVVANKTAINTFSTVYSDIRIHFKDSINNLIYTYPFRTIRKTLCGEPQKISPYHFSYVVNHTLAEDQLKRASFSYKYDGSILQTSSASDYTRMVGNNAFKEDLIGPLHNTSYDLLCMKDVKRPYTSDFKNGFYLTANINPASEIEIQGPQYFGMKWGVNNTYKEDILGHRVNSKTEIANFACQKLSVLVAESLGESLQVTPYTTVKAVSSTWAPAAPDSVGIVGYESSIIFNQYEINKGAGFSFYLNKGFLKEELSSVKCSLGFSIYYGHPMSL